MMDFDDYLDLLEIDRRARERRRAERKTRPWKGYRKRKKFVQLEIPRKEDPLDSYIDEADLP